MFYNLSEELIRRIFEYDSTYKEKYDRVMGSVVTSKMKILQQFLESSDCPVKGYRCFHSMKTIKTSSHEGYEMIEVTCFGVLKISFCILTDDEKDMCKSRLDIKDSLYDMNPNTLANFVECCTETIVKIQCVFGDDKETCNDVLYDLLGPRFEELQDYLYNNELWNMEKDVHKQIFSRLMGNQYMLTGMFSHDIIDHQRGFYEFQSKENAKYYNIYWHIHQQSFSELLFMGRQNLMNVLNGARECFSKFMQDLQ